MSLSINVLSSEDEQNVEEIKEELKEVNEKIILIEKRLVAANRSLTHLYSTDKVTCFL
jgi:phage-related tail protein